MDVLNINDILPAKLTITINPAGGYELEMINGDNIKISQIIYALESIKFDFLSKNK
jgi:hypothetical protein